MNAKLTLRIPIVNRSRVKKEMVLKVSENNADAVTCTIEAGSGVVTENEVEFELTRENILLLARLLNQVGKKEG